MKKLLFLFFSLQFVWVFIKASPHIKNKNILTISDSIPKNPLKKRDKKLILLKSIKTTEPLSSCLISPDGKYIIASKEGYFGLYLFSVKTATRIATISENERIGYAAQWSLDSKNVLYREKNTNPESGNKFIVKQYNINSKKSIILENVNPNALQSYVHAQEDKDPIVTISPKSLNLNIASKDGSKSYEIKDMTGTGFYQPVISPDLKKIIAHSGSKMHLIKTDETSSQILVDGIASCWFPDNTTFLYFLDESNDGHSISGSDIYSYNILTHQVENITHSSDKTEMFPSISSNGKKMSCIDEKTGEILIYKLIFKN